MGFSHIICCLWIMVGKFENNEDSWLPADSDIAPSDLYLTSFYFTITTITTVGYGDISAATFAERIVAVFIMFVGVIVFSYASGSLTTAIL